MEERVPCFLACKHSKHAGDEAATSGGLTRENPRNLCFWALYICIRFFRVVRRVDS